MAERRAARRSFESRVRPRMDDADLFEFVAGLLVCQHTEVDVAREAYRAGCGITEFLVGDVKAFEFPLEFLRRADDDGFRFPTAGCSGAERSETERPGVGGYGQADQDQRV